MKNQVIITYGTFDLFHIGHLKLLQRLSKLGEELHVGVSTDEFNSKKGKSTVIPFAERIEIVAGCRFVTSAFPENSWDQKRKDIVRCNATIFAMGDDWTGHFDDLMDVVNVVYLSRTKGISSTQLKQVLKGNQSDKREAILKKLDSIKDLVKEF